jgi:hypothetical protein
MIVGAARSPFTPNSGQRTFAVSADVGNPLEAIERVVDRLDEVGRAGAQALTGANLRCWSRHPDTDAMIAPDAVNRLPVDILSA